MADNELKMQMNPEVSLDDNGNEVLDVQVERQEWMDDAAYKMAVLEEVARMRTLERELSGGTGAIIAVKAQHPLTVAGKPGL